MVYVTHDQVEAEATTLADRIAILGQGHIRQVDAPSAVYNDPHSLHVARRLGTPAINVLPAAWFEGVGPPRAAQVAIRPEDVQVGVGNGPTHFEVVEYSLVKHLAVAERDGVEVRARTRPNESLRPGMHVRIAFPSEHCLFFDAVGQRLAT